MAQLKIIARYSDGRMLKGTTHNFAPTDRMFYMTPVGAEPDAAPIPVWLSELKAVFIVRNFRGRAGRRSRKTRLSYSPSYGERLEVTFQDGEALEGFSFTYDPGAIGFFIFPADLNSNNERIFVVNAAVQKVRSLHTVQAKSGR